MVDEVKNTLINLLAEIQTTSYCGPFDGNVLSTLASKLENELTNDPVFNKKILKVFVELAQNIALYSSDKVITADKTAFNGYGLFFIREYPDKVQLIAANMAFKQDAEIVDQKCKQINSLTRDQLRELKRDLRKKPMTERGGGNIGLVQIVLTANTKLNYKIIDVDDKRSFVIISVDVNKKED